MTETNVVTLQQAITDLSAQINGRLDAMVVQSGAIVIRIDRIDRAVVGEEILGHVGLVERMGVVERERKDGDARLHKRIDSIEDQWNRAKWLAVGVGTGAGLTGGGVVALVMKVWS